MGLEPIPILPLSLSITNCGTVLLSFLIIKSSLSPFVLLSLSRPTFQYISGVLNCKHTSALEAEDSIQQSISPVSYTHLTLPTKA